MPDYLIYYPTNFDEGNDLEWYVNEGYVVLPGDPIFQSIREPGHWAIAVFASSDFQIKKIHIPSNSTVSHLQLVMTVRTDEIIDNPSSLLYRNSLAGPVYGDYGENFEDLVFFDKIIVSPENEASSNNEDDSDEIISIYVRAGLDEEFAKSIVNGANPDNILDLWEADWRKQYPSDDPLITAILTSRLTNEDGHWLNSIRSDHELIVLLCADGHISIEFAKSLLSSGFDKHPEAVLDVIQGADPSIIARVRKIETTAELPPRLEKRPPRKYFV